MKQNLLKQKAPSGTAKKIIAGGVLTTLMLSFMISCDDGKTKPNPDPKLEGNVKISAVNGFHPGNTAKIDVDESNANTFVYQWTRSKDGKDGGVNFVIIDKATGQTYVITDEDVGFELGATLKSLGFEGEIYGRAGEDNKVVSAEVARSEDITIAANKTVTVNFTAKPGVTPTWWGTLEEVFQALAAGFDIGHYTLNVTSDGTGGFVVGDPGSKTATVSETFLSESDYTTMGMSMGAMVDLWGAVANLNNARNTIYMAKQPVDAKVFASSVVGNA
jgi:hypothetical protein